MDGGREEGVETSRTKRRGPKERSCYYNEREKNEARLVEEGQKRSVL
jgi:hypothetical protein